MVILYAITLIVILFIWYKFYYAPKRQIKRYVKLLRELGYKVIEEPFAFMKFSLIESMIPYRQKYGDALYAQKNIYCGADFTVGNVMNKVVITIINTNFIREFWSVEGIAKYHKFEIVILATKLTFGQGMLFSQGEKWKNKRRVISKAFSFDLLKENIPKVAEISNKWMDHFEKEYEYEPGKVKFDPLGLGVRIFNGVVMKCFFGCDAIEEKVKGKSFEEFTVNMFTNVGKLFKDIIFLFFGKLAIKYGLSQNVRVAKEESSIFLSLIRQLCEKRAEEVRSSKKADKITDILQAIIYQRMEGKEQYEYSDQQLIDEFASFIVAGTDTTSRFFTMMLYYISNDPKIQQKLRSQVEEFIKCEGDITIENLKKVTYLDWIQNETTRHYGPVNGQFFREAQVDNLIINVPITKGTLVSTQPMANHYNPALFANPAEFRPERWEKECDQLPPYAFTGFSGGPRGCIGKQLALLESKIAVIRLVMRFKQFVLVNPQIKMNYELLYEPTPFEIIFIKREK